MELRMQSANTEGSPAKEYAECANQRFHRGYLWCLRRCLRLDRFASFAALINSDHFTAGMINDKHRNQNHTTQFKLWLCMLPLLRVEEVNQWAAPSKC